MQTKRMTMSVLLILIGLFSFATASPQPGLDAWFTNQCPSLPQGDQQVEPVLFDSEFPSDGSIVDIIGEALQEASDFDVKGLATNARSPGFLFQMDSSKDEPQYSLPSCAVLAISNSMPESWCHDQASLFKDQHFCSGDMKPNIADILTSPKGSSPRWGTSAPTFYAEIELIRSPDGSSLLPRLQTLYYPEGIHNTKKYKSNKPRDLSLTVAATTPFGGIALTTLLVVLQDLVPTEKIIIRRDDYENATGNAILDNVVPPLWIIVSTAPTKVPKISGGTYFHPVNISASVREVGDPSRFQRLAEAVSTNQLLRLVR